MRVFIAVEISDVDILKKIQRFQESLQINAKPTKINQIHFTLQFLGEITKEKCEEVKDELTKILDDREKVDKYLFTRDCIDILNENPVHFKPQEFIDILSPITPRLYSISSSPKAQFLS